MDEFRTCSACGCSQHDGDLNFCIKCGVGRPGYYKEIVLCPFCGTLPTPRVSKFGETFCFNCGKQKRENALDDRCRELKLAKTNEYLEPGNPYYINHCPACGVEATMHSGAIAKTEHSGAMAKQEENASKLSETIRSVRRWYWSGPGWNVTAVVVGLLVGLVGSVWFYGSEQQESDGVISNSGEAAALCQVVVKDSLKDPGSASFSEATASRSNSGGWTSRGIVTAKNSFGAFTRSFYECTLSDTNVTSVSVR